MAGLQKEFYPNDGTCAASRLARATVRKLVACKGACSGMSAGKVSKDEEGLNSAI